jgi:phage terminase small subunit|nr:MAG TPA: Terminase small subunit [Caudoviricetes sp.]
MIVAEKKLTAKQQRFCDEYLLDLNATQAAIRAGYSKKTAKQIGQQNLTKLDLKEYIGKRMAEKEAALVADQTEVMRYLTSVLRGQSVSEVVVVEGTGDGCSEARTMQKAPDEKERLKAAELLGKAHMIFTDKVQQEVDMDLNITVDYGDADE